MSETGTGHELRSDTQTLHYNSLLVSAGLSNAQQRLLIFQLKGDSMRTLGMLKKVELREVWRSEASDFTPWLAEEENVKLLGDAIGLDLEVECQEKGVGPFRADLLCRNTASDEWVVIENQIERTDHTHLGQILTYAAGLNAVTVVWIAKQFTEEHRAALDWLNERTDTHINFFGLEIELYQIRDSPIAPKFNIVSQPNDWSRTVQKAASELNQLTEHKQMQLKFWTAFRDFMEKHGSLVKCQKPFPQHWTNHAIGRAGAHLVSVVSMGSHEQEVREPEIRVELYLDGPRAKQEFIELESRKAEIEASLGFPVVWHNPENTTMAKVYTRIPYDFTNESQWGIQFKWLKVNVETMHRVFSPIMREMKTRG